MANISRTIATAVVSVGALLASTQALAVYTINVVETGGNVVATGSGSFDLTGLTSIGSGFASTVIRASTGIITVGPSATVDLYSVTSGPVSFGSGGNFVPDATSGSQVSAAFGNSIRVPQGYVSNTVLAASTSTWNSQTFLTLGLTPGTYTWTLGSGDSLVLNIGTPPNTAPTFVSAGAGSLTVAQAASATDITGLLHVSDSDSSQTETWNESLAPSHGSLSFTSATASSGSTDITPGGTITYTPTASYVGADSFIGKYSVNPSCYLQRIVA
jgi:hypothetical protein